MSVITTQTNQVMSNVNAGAVSQEADDIWIFQVNHKPCGICTPHWNKVILVVNNPFLLKFGTGLLSDSCYATVFQTWIIK